MTRKIGLALLWTGFFAAAFVSVRQLDRVKPDPPSDAWKAIEWPYYLAAMAAGVAGVVMLRATARRAPGADGKAATDLATLRSSLASVNQRLDRVFEERSALDVYEIAPRIDRDLTEDLGNFADARETMIPVVGLQSYADIMSRFAAGERAVNRAWCASADGYIDEVWDSLARARELLKSTRDALEQKLGSPG